MIRRGMVLAVLLLGAGQVLAQQDIAVQQDNLMRVGIGKNMYGVIGRMGRGDAPYDQAAIDGALAQMEENVGKIATVFTPNPKQDIENATYGSSPKVWQNKADFDSRIPPVLKAIADVKGKITDVASLKAAYTAINDKCNACHETYRLKLK